MAEKPQVWSAGQNNCVWYTAEKPRCDACGRKNDAVVELKNPLTGEFNWYCHLPFVNECYRDALVKFFGTHPECENALSRIIEHKPSGSAKARRKADPVGLAKRYAVLKRDGFQCVLCGASGATAKLEVDHEIPVAKGGASDMSNLRTLCFNCNRGKSDSE